MQTHIAACTLLCLGAYAAIACSGDGNDDQSNAHGVGGTTSRAAGGESARDSVHNGGSEAIPRAAAGAPAMGGLESSGGDHAAGAPPTTGGRSSPRSPSSSAGQSAAGGTSTNGAAPGEEQTDGNAASSGGTRPSTGGAASATGGALAGVGGENSDPAVVGGASGKGAGGAPPAGAPATTGSAVVGGAGGAGTEPSSAPPLVITEIMFNPQSTPELEWVELCNTTRADISLGGYTFWDDDNDDSVTSNFPAGSTLPAESCVVLIQADDVASFAAAWGETILVVGLTSFPLLTNTGDRVQLWDATHLPVASDVDPGTNSLVSFDYSGSLGDGSGSIELTSISADPSLRESWELSTAEAGASISSDGDVGTPGVAP